MNKILKWTLIILSIGLITYVGFWVYAIMSFSASFGSNYSKKDLVNNYELKSKEIAELKDYVNAIVANNTEVIIEFEGDRTISIFHVTVDGKYYSNRDIKVNSSKTDAMLQKLGWSPETLSTLKEKLDEANCISIESGNPCTIGYQRSGMGMYLYKVFNETSMNDYSYDYNDSCTYIYYKDNIVLEYRGGAIGPQCFEDFKRKAQ